MSKRDKISRHTCLQLLTDVDVFQIRKAAVMYLIYLHTFQETFKQFWVPGPHHLDLLPLNALEKLVFIFLNHGSHLQMALITLYLLGRTKLIGVRKNSGGIDQVKLSLYQTQSKCKNYKLNKQVSIGQHLSFSLTQKCNKKVWAPFIKQYCCLILFISTVKRTNHNQS